MTYVELKTRFPHMPESTVLLNATDRIAPISPPKTQPKPQTPVKAKRTTKAHEPPDELETHIQQRLIKWWATECTKHELPEETLMAFPLQAGRTARNGARMKAEGMRKGTPDLFLSTPRHQLAGLWIELKRRKGYLQPHQKAMLAGLTSRGYATIVCRGYIEATHAITAYLSPALIPQPIF